MILLIDLCWKKDSLSKYEFVLPIAKIVAGAGLEYEIKHRSEKFDISKYERVIMCGTALQDDDSREIKFDWLVDCSKPILGICAGFQLIGKHFGSSVVKEIEIGMFPVKTLVDNKLFSDDFEVYNVHSGTLKDLDSFDILAASGDSVQAVKLKEKEIYGVAFHPEVRQQKIVENFLT